VQLIINKLNGRDPDASLNTRRQNFDLSGSDER
jgi:hypothetical protein